MLALVANDDYYFISRHRLEWTHHQERIQVLRQQVQEHKRRKSSAKRKIKLKESQHQFCDCKRKTNK